MCYVNKVLTLSYLTCLLYLVNKLCDCVTLLKMKMSWAVVNPQF